MTISMERVREALRKDDHDYLNDQILRLMDTAKAALYVETGYKENETKVPESQRANFENLSDSYIIEYVRAHLDQVDNKQTLTTIATQLEAILKSPEAASPESASKAGKK